MSEKNKVVTWQPQPGPQTAFVHCPIEEIFYGGARGGGKTDSAIGKMLIRALQFGKGERGIFFRRTYKQLEEVMLRAHDLFPPHNAKWREKDLSWTFPNGAWIKFGYLERDSDAQNHQGKSYTCICIEEAGTFPSFDPIAKLKATLRSAKGVPTQMLLTGNPGGPGSNWVRARYIDPYPAGWRPIRDVQSRMLPNGKTEEFVSERIYIPSRVTDNAILMQKDPNYISRLMQSGSEQLVKAWLEGDFYVIDGAFFDNWDSKKHILKPCELPPWWTRFRSCDWGSARPFCVLWIAVASEDWVHPQSGHLVPKGAFVVYDEWYGVKTKPTGEIDANKGIRLYAEDVGRGILSREAARKFHIDFGVLDPSAFAVDGGPSIAERIYRSTNGAIKFRPADNKRVAKLGAMSGWDQVRGRLGGIELERATGTKEKVPMLFVFESAQHLIRTLPMMQHNENNPEDMDTEGEDHACFTAGTLVETEGGPVEISSLVGKNFRVASVGGFADASAALTRKSASVFEYTLSDGSCISATPDHRIVCADGVLRTIHSVLLDKHAILHNESYRRKSCGQLSYLRQFRSSVAFATTFAAGTFSARANGFIGLFGSAITGTFQKACMSTTATATAPTMTFPISLSCLRKTTLVESTARRVASGRSSIFTRLKRLRKNGMAAKRVARGTGRIILPCKTVFTRGLSEIACTAGQSTKPFERRRSLFVRTNANLLGVAHRVSIALARRASRAVLNFLSIDIQKRKTALANAAAKVAGSKWLHITSARKLPDQAVYCLSVPSTGLFYLSNGVLVTNCDTLRYACMTRPIEAQKPPSRNDQISTIHDVKLEQLFEENERGSRNAIGYDRI